MKANKIIFWITTSLIFLTQGVMQVIFSQSEESAKGLAHLGYPHYFGIMLTVFKVLGALTLIIPRLPNRLKEWAYAGFAIDFIAASVSYYAVEGLVMHAVVPIIFLAILAASYITYTKVYNNQK
jgi:hypothetical protein